MKRLSFDSPVTLLLIFISFIGLLLSKTIFPGFNELFCLAKPHILDSGIILHIFGHKGWNHLVSNTIWILLLGPPLEDKYGPTITVITTLITSFFIGLLIYFFGSSACYGLSTIVYMYAAWATWKSKDGKISVISILILICFVLPELIAAITKNDSIGHMQHFLGAIFGFLFGFIFSKITKYTKNAT